MVFDLIEKNKVMRVLCFSKLSKKNYHLSNRHRNGKTKQKSSKSHPPPQEVVITFPIIMLYLEESTLPQNFLLSVLNKNKCSYFHMYAYNTFFIGTRHFFSCATILSKKENWPKHLKSTKSELYIGNM